MHRLIRQEEREAEGYHVILKNLKHNVILFFFFQLSFPEIFVLALKKGGVAGGRLNFQSERLDRGTDSSDTDEWCTYESQMLCEGLRNRIRRVIQTLITQWLSGERDRERHTENLSVIVLCIIHSLAKDKSVGAEDCSQRPWLPTFFGGGGGGGVQCRHFLEMSKVLS